MPTGTANPSALFRRAPPATVRKIYRPYLCPVSHRRRNPCTRYGHNFERGEHGLGVPHLGLQLMNGFPLVVWVLMRLCVSSLRPETSTEPKFSSEKLPPNSVTISVSFMSA